MSIARVHFTTGDEFGWAIDEDLRLLRGSLEGVCESTSLARAEAVHAVWWQKLLRFPRRDFRGKHVLCYADNAPFQYAGEPEFLQARERVTLWIGRSREAIAQFAALGIESRFAPYTFDPAVFHPHAPESAEVRALIEKWRIPQDRYLIANFHRDSEGGDLEAPKLQKGPDAFLEIVAQLHGEGAPVHVLLAGPRRHYLRTQLAKRRVPFTFIGEDPGGRDDLKTNILPRTTLNVLYSIADVHLIASRWEGGPHSVLEGAAARCKVVSTPVGIAPDVLASECLFTDIPGACEIVRRDIREDTLSAFTDTHFQRAHAHHTEPALRRHLVEIYRSLQPLPAANTGALAELGASVRHFADRVRSCFPAPPPRLALALLHRPAAGADTEFDAMLARVGTELESRGCTVARNEIPPATNGVLLGRLAADDPLAAELGARRQLPAIGFFDEAAPADPRASADCTILPSLAALAALRQRGALPRRTLVLSPLLPAQKLDTPLAHSALFAHLNPPADHRETAGRLIRLFRVCREILHDENRT